MRRTPSRGFTLIELMVSLVLFSVATGGVLSVAVTMSSAFRDQRALTQTESSARSPMDFMADVLRNASPGVQTGAITDGYAATGSPICNTPAALVVTPNNAGPIPAIGTDSLEVIYASGAWVTSTHQAFDSTVTTLPVQDASGFASGDYAVITDLTTGILVKIATATPGSVTITPLTCTTGIPSGGFPVGSLIIRAMHAKFYIDPSTVDGVPNLMMGLDPNAAVPGQVQPLADGVEDLQVAVGLDNDGNGVVEHGAAANDDEWIYNVAGETMPAGANVIRAIRITLTARAVNANTNLNASSTFTRPKAEDHAAGTVSDIYRRRVLQSTVEIRNLQGSP